MLKIAEMRGDVMGRFHNAMYLGDVHEQVSRLQQHINVVSLQHWSSYCGRPAWHFL
jgi:hypothetical protein